MKDVGWVEHVNGRPHGAHQHLVSELRVAAGTEFIVIGTSHLLAYAGYLEEITSLAEDRGWGDERPSGGLRPVRSHLFDHR